MTSTIKTQDTGDAATLAAPVDDGYMVVHIGRGIIQPAHPRGYFRVTADVYTSKRAFDVGNTSAIHSCGRLDEQVTEKFPELTPLVRMVGADVETGEPIHAEANGWYWFQGSGRIKATERYSGANAKIYAHQLAERGCEDSDEGRQEYCYRVACDLLRVDEITPGPAFEESAKERSTCSKCLARTYRGEECVCDDDSGDAENYDEIMARGIATREDFAAFVDEQRERWADEAREADALIDELASRSVEVPADDDEYRDEWSHIFDGGLKVSAKLSADVGTLESQGRYIGRRYWYDVIVTAPRNDSGHASYRARYGGSVADYEANKIDARQAALGTLHELTEFVYQSADELACEFGYPEHPDEQSAEEKRTIAAMRRAEKFVDKVSNVIEANREVLA